MMSKLRLLFLNLQATKSSFQYNWRSFRKFKACTLQEIQDVEWGTPHPQRHPLPRAELHVPFAISPHSLIGQVARGQERGKESAWRMALQIHSTVHGYFMQTNHQWVDMCATSLNWEFALFALFTGHHLTWATREVLNLRDVEHYCDIHLLIH